MTRRLDRWLGRAIFHPPIIWVCQRAGITQFAFYRYAWWAAALHVVWRNDGGWGWTIWNVIFALGRTLSAGLDPDRPARQSSTLRMLLLGLLAIDIIVDIALKRVTATSVNSLLALAAEYATTIKTIPPRRVRAAAMRDRTA